MANPKLTWRVAPEPTGRWKSFDVRSWPKAEYPNGEPAVMITCRGEHGEQVAYVPREVKNGSHPELMVYIADHHGKTTPDQMEFTWRRLVRRAKTLDEAKAIGAEALIKNAGFMPAEYR